jgi:germination protein M
MDNRWLLVSSRKWLWASLILLALGLVLAGCGMSAKPTNGSEGEQKETSSGSNRQLVLSSERSQVLVYFATNDREYLLPLTIDINPTQEVAKVAVEKLLAGPNNDFVAATIPEGTKLKDIYLAENTGTVYVEFTKQFLELKDKQEVQLALDSLVYTLTELREVERVRVSVEGGTPDELHGVALGEPLQRERGVNFVGKLKGDGEQITLYFSDENAMFMVPVTIEIAAGLSVLDKAQLAIKELLQGPPKGSNLNPVLWDGTKVISLEWNETEKMLVVNFNKEFVGYGGGSTFERQLVSAITCTLTDLPEVKKVQILIEGEKWDYLPEGTDIYEPLTKLEKFNYS